MAEMTSPKVPGTRSDAGGAPESERCLATVVVVMVAAWFAALVAAQAVTKGSALRRTSAEHDYGRIMPGDPPPVDHARATTRTRASRPRQPRTPGPCRNRGSSGRQAPRPPGPPCWSWPHHHPHVAFTHSSSGAATALATPVCHHSPHPPVRWPLAHGPSPVQHPRR